MFCDFKCSCSSLVVANSANWWLSGLSTALLGIWLPGLQWVWQVSTWLTWLWLFISILFFSLFYSFFFGYLAMLNKLTRNVNWLHVLWNGNWKKPSQFVGTVSCQLCGHIGTFGNRDLTRNIGLFSKEIFVKNFALECLLPYMFHFTRTYWYWTVYILTSVSGLKVHPSVLVNILIECFSLKLKHVNSFHSKCSIVKISIQLFHKNAHLIKFIKLIYSLKK